MQHGLFLERLIVIAVKLAIESVAKLAAYAGVARSYRLAAPASPQSLSCADHGRCAASEVAVGVTEGAKVDDLICGISALKRNAIQVDRRSEPMLKK
jgi:hypothetical protein